MNRVSYVVLITQMLDGEPTGESYSTEESIDTPEESTTMGGYLAQEVEQRIDEMEAERRTEAAFEENLGRLSRLAGYLLGDGDMPGPITVAHDGPELGPDDVEYDASEGNCEFTLSTPEGEVRFTLQLEAPDKV